MSDLLKFAVVLEDEVSPGAAKASKAVGKLKNELADAKEKLAGYQSQLRLAKDVGDVEGYRKYSTLVDSSKRSVFDLQQQLEKTPAAANSAGASLEDLAGGPMAMVATAALAAGVAVVGVLVDITSHAVEMALEVTATNDKLVATFDALGSQGPESGKKTLEMLNELSAKLPQSRDQLAGWTKQIEAMGITDLGQIRQQLLATASAQAIMGDEGADAYQTITKRVREAVEAHHGLKLAERTLTSLYKAGLNVDDVSKAMGISSKQLTSELKAGTVDAQAFGNALSTTLVAKGKAPLAAMGDELGTLEKKASETFAHLFDGVDTGPLTEALRNVIALGDQGEPSGQALKKGITGGLNAVIRMIGHAITEAEVFFLEIEVDALEAYIALKPLIKGFQEIQKLVSSSKGGGQQGAGGGALASLTSVAATSTRYGVTAGAAEGAALIAKGLLDAFADAKVKAFNGGVGLGQATIDGLKAGTKSHSPSLEAIKIGGYLSEGLGIGMRGSQEPLRAARQISSNALGGLAQGGMAGSLGGGSSSHRVEIGEVNVHAAQGVTDAHQLSITGLAIALERMQLAGGR